MGIRNIMRRQRGTQFGTGFPEDTGTIIDVTYLWGEEMKLRLDADGYWRNAEDASDATRFTSEQLNPTDIFASVITFYAVLETVAA